MRALTILAVVVGLASSAAPAIVYNGHAGLGANAKAARQASAVNVPDLDGAPGNDT